MTLVLAIESSCDETAAAVIEDGRTIHSNVVASQIDLHRRFGGVVPELAARSHIAAIQTVVSDAMVPVEGDWKALDAIAVTRGPGLVGCLLVGTRFAQAAALASRLPIVGISHLAGHVYSAWLGDVELEPPFLALVVSGGHTDCIMLHEHGRAEHIAGTRDDAVGEAFDKVARLLGLPYPGGPSIQRAASGVSPDAYQFPVPHLPDSFSYSGLKTAVRHAVDRLPDGARNAVGVPEDPSTVAELAAAFQKAAVMQLVDFVARVAEERNVDRIAVVGGVPANLALREAVAARFAGVHVSIPPFALCTDNAAMIGAAAFHHIHEASDSNVGFDVEPDLLTFA